MCHAATQSLARILDDPKANRELDVVLEKTCRWVPGPYYSKVFIFALNLFDYLIIVFFL